MSEIKRVKIDSILESQIPEFLNEDSPLFVEFLRQYYKSLEHQSGSIDLALNINKYKNIEKFNSIDLSTSTTLTSSVLTFDDSISVQSTSGWPDTYGLLKIDDEIMTYTSKTLTSFNGCIRGFSGIDQIESFENSEFLNFSNTNAGEHSSTSSVLNLSNLFLLKFFENFKYEFFPGFEDRDFNENISVENILINARNFYISKGTDSSYKFLFKVLYGTDIDVIKPNDYTLKPSSDSYVVTKNILVEKISGGNPVDVKGNFLFQNISGLSTVSASIFNVEFRPVAGKELYEISLDSSSISGTFQASGQTKILEDVPVGSDYILVDSTIGFSKSGKILVKPENSDFIEISYLDTTSNQFLGVSGITKELKYGLSLVENKFANSYIGFGNTSKVDFRVINVIENIDLSNTNNLRLGDKIKLSSFGKNLFEDYRFNSWITNIPTTHKVKLSEQQTVDKFRLTLFDKIIFYKNENILVLDSNGNFINAQIIDIEYSVGDSIRKFSSRILVQMLGSGFNTNDIVSIRKVIYKSNHYTNYFENIGKYPAGVQNTYIDKDGSNFYVTSSGVPNYTIFVTDDKRTVQTFDQLNRPALFQGLTSSFYCPDHNYVNGNLIFYEPYDSQLSGISTGYYYVTILDQNNIKLSYSKSDIFSRKYLEVKSGITSDTIVTGGFENKSLEHQKIVKIFPFQPKPSVLDDSNKRTTNDRQVGLLVNGVELLSPTYFDENIFYGPIDFIEVTNSGKDYDVVTPPPIEIIDSNGSGVKAHVNLSGKIQSIKIISPGIGYQSKPKINISGGNGRGCSLESNLVKSRISSGFKSEINVDEPSNSINFLNKVAFVDGEEVVYDSNTNLDVPGLINGSTYFVGIVNETQIKLYNNKEDAINHVNEINIVGVSSGFHYFTTLKNKNTITEIYVKNPGEGYSNRKIKVPSTLSFDSKTIGINTFDSYFFAPNHGFSNSDLVKYSTTGTSISGLDTSSHYYVKVIDDNKFKLSFAGTGNTISDSNYINKKYVKFESLGVGTHVIGYPPIVVTVESTSSLGSTTIISPVLKPVVLGSIDDVYVEYGGTGYGCTDIINFHRRPDVGISSVKLEASLNPIVVNGRIVDVKITNKGRGYREDSDIIISGDGNFAKIEPIIDSEGKLSQVNIIDGGIGYGSSNTILRLANRGSNAKFLVNIKQWKVDQVVKLKDVINPNDDGILLSSKNNDLGLQFASYYIPKKLRYQLSDNFTQADKETDETLIHSPIVGYAYDGNPIYGPYGYDKPTGGSVKQIRTSYALELVTNTDIRPPSFPPGYFINDYVYNGSGDLDEHNGRWCVTPQYPNGTYAYFYSVDIDISKVAKNKYPYIVGPTFNNLPTEENFIPSYNQNYNIFTNDITRNIGPYYLNYSNSSYELIDNVFDEYKQEFEVTDIVNGGIHDVSIFSSGEDYKVDDLVLLNNEGTGGSGANIVVSKLDGKEIIDISTQTKTFSNVSFVPKFNLVEAIFDQPHEFNNLEPVYISGISTISALSIEGIKNITVNDKSVQLLENIPVLATTGVSTFIKVKDISGFSDNDFIGIGTEKLLITKVSPERSGFYVNRVSNTGVHTAGLDYATLLPKKFSFKTKDSIDKFVYGNTVTFFDPKETVGTGTDGVTRTVVGLGTTSFESRFIPSRNIYIPNHKFYTGQSLTYNCGTSGTSLYANVVGSAVSFQIFNNQTVYVVNFGKDYIGLSTVGYTTSLGIGTNLNSVQFWDLTESLGVVGSAHSLTTQNEKIVGTVTRTSGIITTKTDHGLSRNDVIKLSVKSALTEEHSLYYDNINRKILLDEISFTNTDVSLLNNTITILGYGDDIKNGTKVIYFATNPLGGLSNEKSYFILKKDVDKISLCEYESDVYESKEIDLSSLSAGGSQKIRFINPEITVYEGSTLKFDLSDNSLNDLSLDFYLDNEFTRKIELIGTFENTFAITRSGIPGQPNSYVKLDTNNEEFPKVLFYKLNPISPLDQTKNQISLDTSVVGFSKINLRKHSLNSNIKIDLINDVDAFSFNSDKKLTQKELTILTSGDITYTTNSKTALGPINDIKINFEGRGYQKLPSIRSIKSDSGKNAVLKLISYNIGRVEAVDRIKDGFDYPTDPTLSPQLSISVVCGIKDIRTIDRINIIDGGNKYNTAPVLIVKNDPSIELQSIISGGSVTDVKIIKNSTSISSPLDIIPTYNSNGYEIDAFSISGTDVTIELFNSPTSYPLITVGYGSTQILFPFSIGDEIFIEKCLLTPATNSLSNYNSSNYDYQFFTVTGINTSNNTLTYSVAGIVTGGFGTYDEDRRGVVINKNDMASFEMILKDDVRYQSSEKVVSSNFVGKIMENGWDDQLNQMRITDSTGYLQIGDQLFGENSKVLGTVEYLNNFELNSSLGVLRDKKYASNTEGILNDFQQRISDNFYYQKFSYSLRSTVPYSVWRESVRSIVHPSGFQEFSDYILYTEPTINEVQVGIAKSQNMKPILLGKDSSLFVTIDSEVDFYSKKNYALVYEDDPLPDGSVERIYFDDGVNLKPYILNKTNKVVLIDDISDQFTGITTFSGSVVGLSTFKLKNNGTSLFKHIFDSSDLNIINLSENTFTIPNHNYQTGQELIYDYGDNNPIGIATTSYVGSGSTTLMEVYNLEGTAILENGYSSAISTSITGISTVLSPVGPSLIQYTQVIGLSTSGIGTDATFNVLIAYSPSTGQPLSTSIVLTSGGRGYSIGETVSIAGTYIGGVTPTNDLTFVISNVGPTGIQTRANEVYLNVPSSDSGGSIFNVTRNGSGYVSNVAVVNGGVGYSNTSIISIAGTYLGGSTYDYVNFTPLELGSNKLPESVFVYKFNDNQFALLGLSTSSNFLDITGFGNGYHSFSYKDPNASVIITIDGVIQSPLKRKSVTVSLGSSVSTSTTTIVPISSGITSISTGDILNLSDEYLLVKNIFVSSNYIAVERGYLGTEVGIHTVGIAGTLFNGSFNIIGDTIFFTSPPYGPLGPIGIQTNSHFAGRVFSRQFDANIPEDKNIIFDDISTSFTGIAATEFTIKTNGNTTTTIFNNINDTTNINNIPLVLINNIFQSPIDDVTVDGAVTNVLKFLDGAPSAGKISKVSISTSYGYQPRLVASADVVVSVSGTISSVIINGGGSGYRNTPPVSLASTIGYGASLVALVGTSGTTLGIVTSIQVISPGIGYTTSSPPRVIIGIPTGYSNLGVAYTAGSSGVGQKAKVTVEVGMGSSIISFKFDDPGIGYKTGDILKVVGINTDPIIGVGFSEFRIAVEEVQTDSFSGFYPGQFIVFNDISDSFNGFRKKFTITLNINGQKQIVGLKTLVGSDLDITNNIFIYLNDILQEPNYSYTFQGSRVVFTEAPLTGSTCTILYYRGSSRDVEEIQPVKTIKEGDVVIIQESTNDLYDIEQLDRVVKTLVSSDQLDTFVYSNIGINTDPTKIRPLTWKKQKSDRVISGTLFSKSRPSLQGNLRPTATIIKSISSGDDQIYLDNAFPLFSDVDGLNENIRDVFVTENRNLESGQGYSVVSGASTVSSIVVTNSGVGYANTLSPKITISESAIKLKDPIYDWKPSTVSGINTLSQFNGISVGKQFISVGNSSLYVYSFDGVNWASGSVGIGSTINLKSVHKVDVGLSDIILTVGSKGKIAQSVGYSNTVTSWTEIPCYEEITLPGAGVVGQNLSSYNGTLNSIVHGYKTSTENSWITVGTGGSVFVASGIVTSKFISRYSGVLQNLNSVDFGNNYFVAVGNNGTVISSTNGSSWDVNLNGVPLKNFNKVLFNGTDFIVVGDNATIIKSVNRDLYQSILNNIDTSENILNISYYNGLYILVTSVNKLYYSFDLSNWSYRSTLQSNQITDFAFSDNLYQQGIYVAVGYAGTIINSVPTYHRATAESVVTNGQISSINIIDGGFGYFQDNAPPVLIEPDTFKTELIKSFKVKGDYGTLIGITTFIPGAPGIGTTSPKLDFTLKSETYDNSTLGVGYSSLNNYGINASQLEKGDYFIISDSNVLTDGSLIGISTFLGGMSNYPNSKIGIATNFLDGVYIVESVTPSHLGIVTVTCHFAPDYSSSISVSARGLYDAINLSFSGINTNGFYGRYSWAKIYDFQNRSLNLNGGKSFEVYTDNGLSGLGTSPKVIRTRSLLSN